MRIQEKSIIDSENVHKIEPFFIRYLTIISSIAIILIFIFFFGTNRLNEEYNTINIWNKPTSSIESPSHDNNLVPIYQEENWQH